MQVEANPPVVLMLALQLLALHVHRVLVSLPRRAIAPLLLVRPPCVCGWVCVWERERERERAIAPSGSCVGVCVCVCVCFDASVCMCEEESTKHRCLLKHAKASSTRTSRASSTTVVGTLVHLVHLHLEPVVGQ